VKRWLLGGPFDCFVQVAPGLEEILAAELLALGLATGPELLRTTRGGIELALDHEGVMRANLALRTAGRVLLRLGTFPAAGREMLYDRARKLPWEAHLGFSPGYRLRLSSKNSKLQAGDEAESAVAGAISRRMRELGLYPKPDEAAPLEFHVRLLDDRCTISLNTSGEHLHRRGTRTHVGTAPLRETLAAAMALEGLATGGHEEPLSGHDEPLGGHDVIVDPFCGSGTLLIEAADVLRGLPPGRARAFAFEQAAWFRPGGWRAVKRDAERQAVPLEGRGPRLLGIDDDGSALAAAGDNLARSGHTVELVHGDSTTFDYDALGARHGLVIGNLPYGVRLGDRREAAGLARRFLDRLAASDARWRVVVLVLDPEPVVRHEAFTVSSVRTTSNGGLPVSLVVGAVGDGSGSGA